MEYDFIKQRDRLVEKGLLRYDDLDNLRIYSYTDRCKTWDNFTLNSRGIIFNRKTGEVIARPFSKFFNMNQRIETQEYNLPWRDGFRIFQKHDGWLGILYRYNGQHKIATRGSFGSSGAIWATEYLQQYDLTKLPDEVTLLFEIICPITHIVVDYRDREDLILLAAYNRHTGEEYPWNQVEQWSKEFGFTLVESYDQDWLGYCRGQIKTVSGAKLEGYVIRFNNGLRVKIKSEDYFRRSYILQHLTPLGIWQIMVNGKVPKEIWGQIDIDYHNLLNNIAETLEKKYQKINDEIYKQFSEAKDKMNLQVHYKDNLKNRVVFAKIASRMSHKAALFSLLDKLDKRVDEYIHRLIRPHKNIIT